MQPLIVPSDGPLDVSAQRAVHATQARSLLRCGVLIFVLAWVLVYVLSVANGQQAAWPLANISQYAAHKPAIYVFRACGVVTATLFAQVGIVLYPRARWALPLFATSGGGLGGAAVVSCADKNDVHTAFAFAAFIGFALCMACAAGSASCAPEMRRRLFRKPLARCTPRLWAAQSGLVWLGIVLALCIGEEVLPVGHKAGQLMVSLIEWATVANLLFFVWHFAGVVV